MKAIYGDEFDPRIGRQGLLFFMWAYPNYQIMSNLIYVICAWTIFPWLGLFFSFSPSFFLDPDHYNEYYEQKPLPGIGKMISQMWASTKLLFFDSAYIQDPTGENLDLDQWTFVGLTIWSLTTRLVLSVFNIFDPLNITIKISMISMLVSWTLIGWENTVLWVWDLFWKYIWVNEI